MASTEFVLATAAFTRKWELIVTSRVATGEQVNADSCAVYQIYADNTSNSYDLYLKIYDTTSGVTTGGSATGSTDPDFVFLLPGGRAIDYTFVEGFVQLSSGLRATVSKDPGTSDASGTSAYSSITVELYGTD
jgi:hypothetical protein